MGQVLVTLIKQMMEKAKQSAKTTTSILVIVLLFTSLISSAQTSTETVVAETPMNYGGMDYNGFWMLSTVIIIEIITILFLMFFINRIQQELLPQKAKKTLAWSAWWTKMDKKIFTRAVEIEKEADILLDHDYDGIKELDNSLPPWWKYGFYVTIVVAMIYLMNFHVFGSGKNPSQEYEAEMEKATIEMANYASKNADKIDEEHLQMPQKGGLDAGKEIFTSVCWTCHGKQGEGGTGPNLTDEYWIHKGSLSDIYQSIKHGYPDKGMQSWAKNYTPKEINNLAGYIKTLKGTNPPNPKAPQGDLFIEDSTTTIAIDTLKTKVK
jgi:cytochrome c oxidase cbb3-type subunit 3